MKVLQTICISVVLVGSLSACRDANFEEVPDASQVAAKVNGNELTVHQINQALMSTQVPRNLSKNEITNQLLDKLISQEVLLQQAMNMELDRDPEALLAIEAAKKQILVQTYLNKVLNSSITPSVSEIQKYFDDNPNLFTNRKLFEYKQIAVQLDENQRNKFTEQIVALNDYELIINEIISNQYNHKISSEKKSTDQLPKALIEPLYSLEQGDIGFLRMDDGLLVLKIINIEDIPVSFNDAKQSISNYLVNQKRSDDTEKLILKLRETAQIEYVGEFKPLK